MHMTDYLLFSVYEAIGFLFLWPCMVEKTTDWSNKSLQRDNPHLRICFFARKWITPSLFILLSGLAMVAGLDMADEFLEIVVLNLLVVLSTLLIGPLVSQYVVEHYMVGRKRVF